MSRSVAGIFEATKPLGEIKDDEKQRSQYDLARREDPRCRSFCNADYGKRKPRIGKRRRKHPDFRQQHFFRLRRRRIRLCGPDDRRPGRLSEHFRAGLHVQGSERLCHYTEHGREAFVGTWRGKNGRFTTNYTIDAAYGTGFCQSLDYSLELSGSCTHHIDGKTGAFAGREGCYHVRRRYQRDGRSGHRGIHARQRREQLPLLRPHPCE